MLLTTARCALQVYTMALLCVYCSAEIEITETFDVARAHTGTHVTSPYSG